MISRMMTREVNLLAFICLFVSLFQLQHAVSLRIRKSRPMCRDRNPEYCLRLFPDNCYVGRHRATCCKTCAHLLMKFMHLPTECRYGDRSKTCLQAHLSPHVCYSDIRRHPRRQRCCETCHAIKKEINAFTGCEFGDRDPTLCMYVQPRHCANAYVSKVCCMKCLSLTSNRIPGAVV